MRSIVVICQPAVEEVIHAYEKMTALNDEYTFFTNSTDAIVTKYSTCNKATCLRIHFAEQYTTIGNTHDAVCQ
jgi:hypothetical protein